MEERVQAGVVLDGVQKRRERLRSEFTHTLITHEGKRRQALGGAAPPCWGSASTRSCTAPLQQNKLLNEDPGSSQLHLAGRAAHWGRGLRVGEELRNIHLDYEASGIRVFVRLIPPPPPLDILHLLSGGSSLRPYCDFNS